MNTCSKCVYLVGSFFINDNYGDVIQAKVWVDWYRKNNVKIVFICHQSGIKICKKNLRLKDTEIISAEDFLNLDDCYGFLHLYGGGYLNKYWCDDFIKIIRFASLKKMKIFATGVQIDNVFRKKSGKYSIEYISVRDPISKELLGGNPIIVDDSLEYFLSKKKYYSLAYSESLFVKRKRVLLQLGLNSYMYDTKKNLLEAKKQMKDLIVKLNEKYFIQMASSFPNSVDGPIENKKLINSLGLGVNDFEYTTTKKLDNTFIDGYEFVLVNSYHTYLMAIYKYCCPVYFLAFNAYYRQKADGLINCGLLKKSNLILDLKEVTKLILKKGDRLTLRERLAPSEKSKLVLENVKTFLTKEFD